MSNNPIRIVCPHCDHTFTLPFEGSTFFQGLTYSGRCDQCSTFVQMSVKVDKSRPLPSAESVLRFFKNQPFQRATIDTISYEMAEYNVDTILTDLVRGNFIAESDTGYTTLYRLLPAGINLLHSLEKKNNSTAKGKDNRTDLPNLLEAAAKALREIVAENEELPDNLVEEIKRRVEGMQ